MACHEPSVPARADQISGIGDGREYRFSYEVIVEDAVEASRFYLSGFFRIARAVCVGAALVGIPVAIWIDPYTGVWLTVSGALLFALSFWRGVDRWLVRVRGRSVCGGTNELVLAERGIDFRTMLGSGHADWSALTDIRVGARTVIFLRDRLLLAYIPASSFVTPAQRDEVVAYARERIAAAYYSTLKGGGLSSA